MQDTCGKSIRSRLGQEITSISPLFAHSRIGLFVRFDAPFFLHGIPLWYYEASREVGKILRYLVGEGFRARESFGM